MSGADVGFWSGKRVLVTGHTGFKGAWLSLWLQAAGADVYGFSRAVGASPSLYDVAGLGPAMAGEPRGDIADLEAVDGAFASVRPEIVFHLAAQPLVRRSYAEPVATYAANLMGTVHVLDAARRDGGTRAVIVVTSDKAYENREWVWGYREDEPMGGHDPYSNSKACAELVTAAYRDSYFRDGPAVATARAGNVIGGGDWGADRLIPDLVRGALDGHPVVLRSPGAIRPWQHVLNPLSGYLRLAERLWETPELAGAWNFGPEDRDVKPVGWIADHLRELWGPELVWEARPDPDAPHEATYVKLDSSKAHAGLGWRPAWGLSDGLRAVVEWSHALAAGASMRAVTLAQIEAYEAAA